MEISEQVNARDCAHFILDKIKANKKRDLLDWITQEDFSWSLQFASDSYFEIFTERLIDETMFVNALDLRIVVNDSFAFVELLRIWAENYLDENPAASLVRVDPGADTQSIEKVKRAIGTAK